MAEWDIINVIKLVYNTKEINMKQTREQKRGDYENKRKKKFKRLISTGQISNYYQSKIKKLNINIKTNKKNKLWDPILEIAQYAKRKMFQ